MQAFIKPLTELEELSELSKSINGQAGVYALAGCVDAVKPHIIYGINHGLGSKIVVTFSEQKARELAEEYRFFDKEAVYFPSKDILFYQSDVRGNAITRERMMAYKALAERKEVTVFTTIDACMDKLIPGEYLQQEILGIAVDDSLDLDDIRNQLVAMGYEYNYQTEAPGQFAVRGGILDIYSLTEENPYRIELWGDVVDSIRSFDAESQKSIENLEQVQIYPASEMAVDQATREKGIKAIRKDYKILHEKLRDEMHTEEAFRLKSAVEPLLELLEQGAGMKEAESFLPYFYKDTVNLFSYLGDSFTIYIDEPHRCTEKIRGTALEYEESMKLRLQGGYILPKQATLLYSEKQLMDMIGKNSCLLLSSVGIKMTGLKTLESYSISPTSVNSYNSNMPMLLADLRKYKKQGYRVILVCPSRSRGKRMAYDFAQEELNAFYTEDLDKDLQPGQLMVVAGQVKQGYEYPMLKYVVLTESDLFGARKKKRKYHKVYDGDRIRSFGELSIGDYVVHESHGLGIYRGIEKVDVDKVTKDYIKIEYAKGGNLYIQATQLDVLQKYAGADAKAPKLNRLGGQEWTKTKTRVRAAVQQIAHELVELYAARERSQGFVYGPDTVWQREFEEMFPYEETDDQLRAIEAVKADMESNKIMERLICGDVGFGKTEIAVRAAFKAIQEGKQVVYLVPTTILAQQHYSTFVQRMKEFPVRVDLLCRFRTAKEQKKTIEDLKKGQVDVVIGTHRVLSKDVEYKDLGLLIIDEEQRFGVKHKEKIKQMKNNIDVLVLSATPIPRTLHMSLVGIRDMSLLEEAPNDRMPIQTYVMEYNDEMVREAISRELARNGQVYYVFNRVKDIVDMTARISNLVPEAVVEFAHGQMKERELEDIMYRYINGDIDVLVSTTIIETGLDISNANTMIIHDADKMGLSQLYQLRGRIGRSNRTAYAFLMYQKNKMISEVAEKRLGAIKEFSQLGSGIKIAMKDLEIRGAGNLLGESQSGHMEAVGYDLYCKMLGQAVQEEKGLAPEVTFDTSVDMDIDAFIPVTYISNEHQKLDIYKRIASIESEEECQDMLDELIDRFGEPPMSVQNLLGISRLRGEAHAAYFTEVAQKGESLTFTFYEQAKIKAELLPDFIAAYGGDLTMRMNQGIPVLVWQKRSVAGKNRPDFLQIATELVTEVKRQLCMEASVNS